MNSRILSALRNPAFSEWFKKETLFWKSNIALCSLSTRESSVGRSIRRSNGFCGDRLALLAQRDSSAACLQLSWWMVFRMIEAVRMRECIWGGSLGWVHGGCQRSNMHCVLEWVMVCFCLWFETQGFWVLYERVISICEMCAREGKKKRDKKEIVRLCVWMVGWEGNNTCKVSVCVCVGEEGYR